MIVPFHVQKNDISELVNMSGPAFSSAMRKAYEEGLGVDFALVCQGATKHVHSQVYLIQIRFVLPVQSIDLRC